MHPYIGRALAAEMLQDHYAEAARARRAREARRHQGAGTQDDRRWHFFPLQRDRRPAAATAGGQEQCLA